MPRRALLSDTERDSLLILPESQDDLIQHYSFTDADLALIRQRRGAANRLGFAVQLCLLRYPGYALASDTVLPEAVIHWIAKQVRSDAAAWPEYGEREKTRNEHLHELRVYMGLSVFGLPHFRKLVHSLADLAMQTDKAMILAAHSLESLRQQRIILPALTVIERACAEAVTRANRRIYRTLIDPLERHHKRSLDNLLNVAPDMNVTWLVWLRQSPLKPNSRYMREHIERLKVFQSLALPDGLGRQIHQNRLLKMAREGAQMTPRDLAKFEDERRYATLAALAIEGMATVTDELVDLHDRIMIRLFSAAKNKHQQDFQKQGKAINDKVRLYSKIGRALVEAKASGQDPYAAIEAVLPWTDFAQSVTEAGQLAQPESFDHLSLVGEQYSTLRRYTPEFLDVLKLKAAPAAQAVLDAIDVLRGMNATGARKVPDDAPTSFVKARWKPLVITDEGLDRRFYEICVLSELKNSLRSGDIWVQGSRQFRDFEEYLLPTEKFGAMKTARQLPIAVNQDCDRYLHDRLLLLEEQLAKVNRLALANELPDAIITDTGLRISPQDAVVPDAAQALIDLTSGLLPRIKITELLMDVDEWTGFTRHFVHLKNGEEAKDRTLLLSAILADAINLGLTKMAESSPGATYAKLSWLQAWHIRDETYSAGLAELVNAQLRHSFAGHWGDGTTSSSDGQRFRAGGRAESTGHINPKYGAEPGKLFYTHISDQYPRQNGLAIALRELGRIERTLFILDWLQNVELRRRVHAGLNKGEARNALARAVFIHRLGEIRDRTFEQQRYRASGLNLVTAAIVLWNTVYLERSTQALREAGKLADDDMLQFLSPLGWEHINLTGDYVWRQSRKVDEGKYRPLRGFKDGS